MSNWLSNTIADRDLGISDNTRVPMPHHNFVPEYQMSGYPWAITDTDLDSSETLDIDFPAVTRWFIVYCNNPVKISFKQTGSSNADKVFYIPAGMSQRLELKCKHIRIIPTANDTTVSVLAGLTNIPSTKYPDQTTDNGFNV
jgi:hypothetical protein